MSISRQGMNASARHEADLSTLRAHLPYWEVNAVEGGFRCKSKTGMNEKEWGFVFDFIKDHFGEDFQEVYHNVNAGHRDFMVYVKYTKDPNPLQ